MRGLRYTNDNPFMQVHPFYRQQYVDMWNNFVQNGVGIVEPAENEISEEAYMDWYYNITKLKIIPPSRATKNPAVYQQARDKCDVSKAMDLIITTARGMSELCLHEMPPVFHDSVLPTFVRGYDELMLETFGPTYERPDFKNVLPKRKARRTTESSSQPSGSDFFKEYEAYEHPTSSPFETTQYDVGPSAPQYDVGPSAQHDVEPSAPHFVYRPVIDFADYYNVPISREDPIPPIEDFPTEDFITMPVPRYEKGHLLKPLNQSKVDWLQAHWWSGQPIDLADIPTHCKERSLRSIAPGNLVEDSIVDEYCKLVMERDRMYYSQSEKAARFYYMSPWFAPLMISYHIKKKNLLKRTAKEWAQFDTDCVSYGTMDKGAIKCCDFDYIIIPIATDGHWILFLWSVKDFRITLFDSLYDDAPCMSLRELYRKEFVVVEQIIPIMFHRLAPERFPEDAIIYPQVENVVERPKQKNCIDCGVFLMKYVDCILTCNSENWLGTDWNEDVIKNFRHRIAWELHKGIARHPTETSLQARLAGL
ncbi:uncharacterized protein LOC135151355 [Daucus carota subsp. sativus]